MQHVREQCRASGGAALGGAARVHRSGAWHVAKGNLRHRRKARCPPQRCGTAVLGQPPPWGFRTARTFLPALRPGARAGVEPGHGAFTDQLPLENRPAPRGCRTRRRGPRRGLTGAHGVDQMGEVAVSGGRASRRGARRPSPGRASRLSSTRPVVAYSAPSASRYGVRAASSPPPTTRARRSWAMVSRSLAERLFGPASGRPGGSSTFPAQRRRPA